MHRTPQKRLGAGIKDASELKSHPFFAGINWDDIAQKRIKPPQQMLVSAAKWEPPIQIVDSPAREGTNKVEGWTYIEKSVT